MGGLYFFGDGGMLYGRKSWNVEQKQEKYPTFIVNGDGSLLNYYSDEKHKGGVFLSGVATFGYGSSISTTFGQSGVIAAGYCSYFDMPHNYGVIIAGAEGSTSTYYVDKNTREPVGLGISPSANNETVSSYVEGTGIFIRGTVPRACDSEHSGSRIQGSTEKDFPSYLMGEWNRR